MIQVIETRAQQRSGLAPRMLMALRWGARGDEPVQLIEQRFNFLPLTFRWRGALWRVRSIVSVQDRGARRYFRVICQDDSRYMLFQNLRLGTWHVRV